MIAPSTFSVRPAPTRVNREPANDLKHIGNSPLLADLLDKWRASGRVRKQFEAQWQVNIEFFAGNHYISAKNGRLLNEPVTEDRTKRKPRPVINYARTEVETLIAYLLRNAPTWSATATRGDAKSQSAAVLSKHLARYYFEQLNGDELLEEAGYWADCAAMGIWEIGWNPLGGPPMEVPDFEQMQAMGGPMVFMPQPLPDGSMSETPEIPMKQIPAGDPYIRLRTPFEFFPDPGASRPADMQWCVTATMRPTDEMKRQYPEFAEEIKPENPGGDNQLARRVQTDWGGDSAGVPLEQMNRTLVLELWGVPTTEWPDGLHAIATQSFLLSAGPTPKGYDHIPFAFWRDKIVPGRFWPDPTMKDLVPLNKMMNRSAAQVIDFSNKHKSKLLAAKDSIDEGSLNDEDGEVVEYLPGSPRPERLDPPDVPDAPLKVFDLARNSMEDSSGANASLQGKVEGEVRSGRQTAYNQSAAENRLSLPAKHLARFLSRSGSLMLRQVATNVTEPRIAHILGSNRTAQIRMFTGADIAGATDVRVEPGSLLGFSRQERFDKVLQLADKEILSQEQTLEALELEDFYSLTDEIATDRNNAYAEEEPWRQHDFSNLMEPGTLQGVWYFEDHRVHLNTHNKFRKSPDYRLLPPPERVQVDAHCKVHEFYVNAANGMNPQPPGAPGGSAPQGPQPEPGGAPDMPGANANDPNPLPGGPQRPAEMQESIAQSGQEIAEGLPPVKPVPRPGVGQT